jgi:hypothetical protein
MAGDPVSGTPEAAPAPLADLDGSRNALLTRTAAAPAAGSFAIHLASARDPALVAGEWQRLARRHPSLAGLEPRPPVMIEVPGRGTFYRVVGGVFATRSEAVAACDRLRAQNQYCMVVAP